MYENDPDFNNCDYCGSPSSDEICDDCIDEMDSYDDDDWDDEDDWDSYDDYYYDIPDDE